MAIETNSKKERESGKNPGDPLQIKTTPLNHSSSLHDHCFTLHSTSEPYMCRMKDGTKQFPKAPTKGRSKIPKRSRKGMIILHCIIKRYALL